MGDNAEVFSGIKKETGVTYPVLVPNIQGCKLAVRFFYTENSKYFGDLEIYKF